MAVSDEPFRKNLPYSDSREAGIGLITVIGVTCNC